MNYKVEKIIYEKKKKIRVFLDKLYKNFIESLELYILKIISSSYNEYLGLSNDKYNKLMVEIKRPKYNLSRES